MRNWLDSAGDLLESLLDSPPEKLEEMETDSSVMSLLNHLLSWVSR